MEELKELDFDMIPEVESVREELSYDKYVVLSSKELSAICRLVEPLTKSGIDDFSKCVYFACVCDDVVEVRYYNQPYVIVGKVHNASGKRIKDFAILVSTLKSFLSNGFSSVVLVEEKDEINLAFGEQLMYVETKNLRSEMYSFEEREVSGIVSHELANYVFKVVGSVLSMTERASEKVVVVKDGQVNFNTGVFVASIKSPFSGDESMVIYKQVSDSIASLADIAKTGIRYGIVPESSVLVVKSDEMYCEFPVGLGERVNAFISPSVQMALQFKADVSVRDEMLYSLVKLVQSLDYLNDVVTVGFDSSNMSIKLSTKNGARVFPYTFRVVGGVPEVSGDMSMAIGILKVFLDIVGAEVKYAFNGMGLGIKNEIGTFLIRKA